MKKIFGELNITWKKLIIFSIIIGIYTGVVAMLPFLRDTSFADISITFEWWVLFGTLIIINSKSPKESALKCFVFFLISQPIVYLVQVPFNPYGWGIFKYYPEWFKWTCLTLPMGYVGYYLKKDKWWGLFILTPVILFVGSHYSGFLREALTFFPNHLLSAIFCAFTMILYSLFIFNDKKLKYISLGISIVTLIGMSVLSIGQGNNYYNTTVLISGGETGFEFDDTYTVTLKDEDFGRLYIVYEENIEEYMVNAEFKKTGETEFRLTSPDGEEYVYKITVNRSSYERERIQ